MSFIDYTNAVLREYENKRKTGNLSTRLNHPSPAELRDECEALFAERSSGADAVILKTFFGTFSKYEQGLQLIRNHSIDKFRPLVNFLNGEVKEPRKKNLDLIAWLIDFKPRPFELGRDYTCVNNANDSEIVDTGENTSDTFGIEDRPVTEGEKVEHQPDPPPKAPLAMPPKKRGFKIIAGSSIAAALALLGVFVSNIGDPPPVRSGHCMYWADDHYEPSPCTPKRGDTLLVDLDSAKLFRFKKITRPETITKDDIGRVTYIRLDGRREYYTDTGAHPVYTNKKLKLLTKFIYERHILPLKQ